MRILIVEDDPDLGRLLSRHLSAQGFVADWVVSQEEALAAIRLARFSLILLDRRLPEGDGILLIKQVRAAQPGAPILMLTALDRMADKIGGLDAGADDYLTKPVDMDELAARIRAALRRPGAEPLPPIVCGELSFDPAHREASVHGAPLQLKRRELAVLECLMLRARRVVQRQTLVDYLYGFDDDVQSNALEAHVSRLRARLSEAGAGVLIHPVRGVGYVLDEAKGH